MMMIRSFAVDDSILGSHGLSKNGAVEKVQYFLERHAREMLECRSVRQSAEPAFLS